VLRGESINGVEREEGYIKKTLGDIYGVSKRDVFLSSTGMSALYSIFNVVNGFEELVGKESWCQLGWLYLDTGEILSKYSQKPVFISDVNKLEELEKHLILGSIKAVITEVPTNPLILVPHLEKLSSLCKKYRVPFVLDTSL
jgi:cystathionine gamma-synthase